MFVIRQRVDLLCQLGVLALSAPMQYGDALAHEWQVAVERNGNPVDLTGYSVNLYARRGDGSTAGPLPGSISGSTVKVTFPGIVYNVEGDIDLILRLTKTGGSAGTETVTIAALHARVARDTTDSLVTEEVVVPSLADLLSQIEAMEQGTAYATAQGDYAKSQGDYAKSQGDYAKSQGDYADGRGDYADEQAGIAAQATLEAQAATSAAQSITQQVTDQIVPQFSIGTVTTVLPEQGASASITGTTRQPILNLSLPRGHDGDSAVKSVGGVRPDNLSNVPLTVCGVSPDSTIGSSTYGNVPLSAADVGAVPTTRTVNGKALSGNISLTASDVGAMAATEPHLQQVHRWHLSTDVNGTWTAEAGGYRQTLTCLGLTADDDATIYFDSSAVGPSSASTPFYYYSLIWCVECRADQVTVHMLTRNTTYFVLEVIR